MMCEQPGPGILTPAGPANQNAHGDRFKKTAADRSITALDETAALRLTERIRLLASSLAEQVDKIIGLIDEARAGQADVALGYPSWTTYVETEFADALPRLDRSQRQNVVAQLTAKGMSTRAIAPIVGASQRTVVDDVSRTAHLTSAPEIDDVVDAELIEDEPAPVIPITGRDGKTYTRPMPTPPADNRKPITDAFLDKITDLLKIVTAITDLAADDRFARNKEHVAARNGSDLRRAIDALTGVAEHLDLLDDHRADGTGCAS